MQTLSERSWSRRWFSVIPVLSFAFLAFVLAVVMQSATTTRWLAAVVGLVTLLTIPLSLATRITIREDSLVYSAIMGGWEVKRDAIEVVDTPANFRLLRFDISTGDGIRTITPSNFENAAVLVRELRNFAHDADWTPLAVTLADSIIRGDSTDGVMKSKRDHRRRQQRRDPS